MKFEVLKQSHLKRNIIIGVVAVLIISTIVLTFTSAKYRFTSSIPVVNGTINYEPYNFRIMEIHVDDILEYEWNGKDDLDVYNKSVDLTIISPTMQDRIFILDEEKSYCTTNNENGEYVENNDISITYSDLILNVSNNQSKAKCYLYFNEIIDTNPPTTTIAIAQSTSGTNGWYKALSLNISGTDEETEVTSIKYCITTGTTCTPTTTVEANSTNVSLTSNANNQRICAQTIDKADNNSQVTCSDTYKVDTANPTISITSTSATDSTIRVTVRGSDSHSGLYQYKFSSNNGNSYTTVTSNSSTYTYTFNNLNYNTNYTIAVQSVDQSGRTSSKVTRSVKTSSTKTVDTVLGNLVVNLIEPDFNKTSCSSGCGEATVGIYEETTTRGTTYYWRGDVSNNYLVFAGFYWRIIRINENGSIRVIYSGEKGEVDSAGKTTVLANGYNDGSTDYTQIQMSKFNSGHNRSYYVGFTYTSNSQRPSTQNGGTDSVIKGVLEDWYDDNIANNSNYSSKIDRSAGFCNDRNTRSGQSWVSSGSSFNYAAYERLQLNHLPTFECSNTRDLYTTNIGLITADEVSFAGGRGSTANESYYLYTGNEYWTMSPFDYYDSNAVMFNVDPSGDLAWNGVDYYRPGVRPVINISPNVTITGSGTISNPYVVN